MPGKLKKVAEIESLLTILFGLVWRELVGRWILALQRQAVGCRDQEESGAASRFSKFDFFPW
jgi:hypothetical protein